MMKSSPDVEIEEITGLRPMSDDEEELINQKFYPASTVLRLQVLQVVSAIFLAIFSIVTGLDGVHISPLIGGLAGLMTILAAGTSIHRNPVMLSRKLQSTGGTGTGNSRPRMSQTVNNTTLMMAISATTPQTSNYQLASLASATAPSTTFTGVSTYVRMLRYAEIICWSLAACLCAAVTVCSVHQFVSYSQAQVSHHGLVKTHTQLIVAIINFFLSLVINTVALVVFY